MKGQQNEIIRNQKKSLFSWEIYEGSVDRIEADNMPSKRKELQGSGGGIYEGKTIRFQSTKSKRHRRLCLTPKTNTSIRLPARKKILRQAFNKQSNILI
jgi:hypothetical protein